MANLNLKAAWRIHDRKSAAGTTQEITAQVRQETRRAFVDRVCACNQTRASSTCQVYLEAGGYRYHLAALTLTTANTWYSAQVQAWLYEGESLVFAFASVAAADVLDVAALGNQELKSEPGPD
jgi:hypothetical protein